MDCQERLVTQAAMTKKANPKTKVWVYRNIVKALPWWEFTEIVSWLEVTYLYCHCTKLRLVLTRFKDVRTKINDPQFGGWFLHKKDNDSAFYHVCALLVLTLRTGLNLSSSLRGNTI